MWQSLRKAFSGTVGFLKAKRNKAKHKEHGKKVVWGKKPTEKAKYVDWNSYPWSLKKPQCCKISEVALNGDSGNLILISFLLLNLTFYLFPSLSLQLIVRKTMAWIWRSQDPFQLSHWDIRTTTHPGDIGSFCHFFQ